VAVLVVGFLATVLEALVEILLLALTLAMAVV
jgi:hypothetical protein